MEENEMKCPECDGEMESGQLVDNSYTVSGAQEWARHATSVLGIGKSKGIKIVSFRCKKCGFLKNFAIDTTEKDIESMLKLR